MNILEIKNITKNYGKKCAVSNLSMTIGKGEAVAFIGPNGAGKSTTMRAISGLLHTDAGSISIMGHDVATAPVEARKHLGFVPQDIEVYPHLTGDEFLNFVARIRNVPADKADKQIESLLELSDLKKARHQLIREYSGGMARKIAMAAAFVGSPELVVLDESFVGLDPESTFKISRYIKQYTADGGAVLISSHILEMLQSLCSRFFILHHGKCVADYSKKALLDAFENPETPDITSLYLYHTEQKHLIEAFKS
ncbi:MAG: ABC transporter ATP-binding protein [Proteobacteria bacterium]|nr:ABC transporter ATP-binding protein [Pseudomonadota bacterium]